MIYLKILGTMFFALYSAATAMAKIWRVGKVVFA